MNFILPDSKLENFDIDKDLLIQIQNSMDILREEDWNDAENKTLMIFQNLLIKIITLNITWEIFIIKQMVIYQIFQLAFMTYK